MEWGGFIGFRSAFFRNGVAVAPHARTRRGGRGHGRRLDDGRTRAGTAESDAGVPGGRGDHDADALDSNDSAECYADDYDRRAGLDDARPERATSIEPADIEPANIRPANIRPANIRPAGNEPADIRPADIEPASIQPAGNDLDRADHRAGEPMRSRSEDEAGNLGSDTQPPPHDRAGEDAFGLRSHS